MTGPLSGSPRPGEDDSWESLAEDLFGIDFHRGGASNLADDDDDDDFESVSLASKQPEPAPVDEIEEDDEDDFVEDDDLEAGFPEEDDDFGAGFDDEIEEKPKPPVKRPEPAPQRSQPAARRPEPAPPREKKPEAPTKADDEGDPFWDALNDWDWGDRTSPRKRPEPVAEREPVAEELEEEPAAESPPKSDESSRGRRGRRRGRGGRGGRVRSESGERAEFDEREEAPRNAPPAREPVREPIRSPLSKLVEDFEFEPEPPASVGAPAVDDGDDDGFGAGLLDPPRPRDSGRSLRPAARREEPRRAERSERAPSAGPARSRPPERSERPAPAPAARGADTDEDDAESSEGQPRRRRRRRRRRSGEPATSVPQAEVGYADDESAEAGFPDEDTEEPVEEVRPRRRESVPRPEAVRRPAPAAVAESRSKAFEDVPTWAEAIALLVHRRPKTTTGWTPDPEDAERENRPRRPPQRRPRRRSS